MRAVKYFSSARAGEEPGNEATLHSHNCIMAWEQEGTI